MKRSALTPRTAPSDLRSFYWRKDELARFCRRHKLPAAGSKAELTAGIMHFLETGKIPPRKSPGRRSRVVSSMPRELRLDTVMGRGWRCGKMLRAFFVREIGPHFHFNQAMRDFVRGGAGQTLREGVDIWHTAKKVPRGKTVITPQFEYNRHMREFFRKNSGRSLREAIEAWRKKAGRARRSRGYPGIHDLEL
jgi:hypothetical protein